MDTTEYRATVKTQGKDDESSIEITQDPTNIDLENSFLRVVINSTSGSYHYEDAIKIDFTEALKKLAKQNPTNYQKLAAIVRRYDPAKLEDLDKDLVEMASIIVKRTKSDWKHLFKFKKNALWPVHFYDITGFDGWSADYCGKVTDLKSNKEAPFLETLKVVS